MEIALDFPSVFSDLVVTILSPYVSDVIDQSMILRDNGTTFITDPFEVSEGERKDIRNQLVSHGIPHDMYIYLPDNLDMLLYFRPAGLDFSAVDHFVPMREGDPVVPVQDLELLLQRYWQPSSVKPALENLVEHYRPYPPLKFWRNYPFQHMLEDKEEPYLICHLSVPPSLTIENVQIVQCSSCHRYYRFEPNGYNDFIYDESDLERGLCVVKDGRLLGIDRGTPCAICSPDSLRLVALIGLLSDSDLPHGYTVETT